MARPKPSEEMTNVSIRDPLSLVEGLREKGTNLSEITVSYWKSLSSPSKIDEHFATIQSKIAEYIKEDPTIPRLYSRDDMAAERVIKARLLIDQLDATASEISAAIVASGKVSG